MRPFAGLFTGIAALALLANQALPAAPRGRARSDSERRSRFRPPLCPRWALQPWVWDDRGADTFFSRDDRDAHHTSAVLDLVDGYRQRGIPVGAVVIDSPWSTNYNTFLFDPRRFEDPRKLIRDLHGRGVRVVLWMTSMMNPAGAAFGDESDFREALNRRYLLLRPDLGLEHWWKGNGGLVDFYNPLAVKWWHGLMDRALDLGIDGWKVDKVEASLPEVEEIPDPGASNPTIDDYRQRYFHDTYRHLLSRRPDGVVIQRPFYTRTVADTPAAWAGDQPHSWRGLRSALRLVLGGARVGNAVIGSDIGGYLGGHRPDKEIYLRWVQFGALCPLMETGGSGERRPWMIDAESTAIFRYYATLHTELIPYFYTWMAETHLTGRPMLKAVAPDHGEFLLGPDLFISAVMQPAREKEVRLPAGEWIDFWDPTQTYRGPARLTGYPASLQRLPLFIRRGAILPLDARAYDAWSERSGALAAGAQGANPQPPPRAGSASPLTLAIYPGGATVLRYRYETGPQSFGEAVVRVNSGPAGVTVAWQGMPVPVLLSVRNPAKPREIRIVEAEDAALPERSSPKELAQVERGWSWDPQSAQAWVKPGPARTGTVSLQVADAPRTGG